MDLWTALLDILILLTAAMFLGGLCQRFRQSPLLGYLLAGAIGTVSATVTTPTDAGGRPAPAWGSGGRDFESLRPD